MLVDTFKVPVATTFSRARKWLEKVGKLSPQDNSAVLMIILAVALFIILLRLLAPFEVYWDQGIQLEGAHRLASGLGLTTT